MFLSNFELSNSILTFLFSKSFSIFSFNKVLSLEFSIPITVTNEINKFNISNYSFAKLGYDRENADSTYGFSKVRVDITYEVTDNKLNAADLAKNLICEDKAFINENSNPVYPEYYGITAFSAGKTVEAAYPFK